MRKSNNHFEIDELRKDNPQNRIEDTDTYTIFKRNYMLYPEGYFRGMLVMERKRSERSKDPFILMLINIKELVKMRSFRLSMNDVIIKKIAAALFMCTREIDIKGWYKQGRIIGILFTELDNSSKESMVEKITECLENAINSRQMAKIEISSFCFPQTNGKTKHDNPDFNKTLYKHTSMGKLPNKTSRVSKRVIDIIGSIAGIVLFAPLFLVIPILIKITSKGPVLFKQKRLGRYGKIFTFLKFRTMYVDNDNSIHQEFITKYIKGDPCEDSDGEKVYKMKDDPRITKIGKLLRKSSMDELPQLLNVLMGNMSLVGPRPAIPYEVEKYDTWHKRRVLEAKPGITGMWQVDGRSNTPFEKMVRMDINYIRNWSLLLDFKLLLKTPISVLMAKGAL